MSLIDSHAHLCSLTGNIDEILERAQQAGVQKIVNIATTPEELEQGLLLSQKYPWIYNVGATTPHDVEKEGEACFAAFEQKAKTQALKAVGETGLDYHYTHSNKELQQHFLKRYLHLATQTHLPVVFHCREAFKDLFSICDAVYGGRALLHCFTGTLEEAHQVLQRGWYLSLSGIVTFKKSTALQEVAKEIPLNRLLIETDAPYLAPQRHRGEQNEPAFLKETAQCIAQLKGISIEELAHATAQNATQFFAL